MKAFVITLIFSFLSLFVLAQACGPSIYFQEHGTSNFQTNEYLIASFTGIPSLATQKELKDKEIRLINYLGNFDYMVKMPSAMKSEEKLAEFGIRDLRLLSPEAKVASSVFLHEGAFYVQVFFWESIPSEDAKTILNGNYSNWDQGNTNGRLYKIRTDVKSIYKISTHPLVAYISPTSKDFKLHIEENIETSRAGFARHTAGLNLTGNGVTVSVGDGGTIIDHPDLETRLQNESSIDGSTHGSQTTGIVAGEGILDPKATGFAPSSTVYADYFSRVIAFDDDYYNNFDVVISNNSYSTNVTTTLCEELGTYTAESMDVDASLRTLNEVIHVFAAGNDGNATCNGYPQGYSTVQDAWNAAKNTLTVGATDYLDDIAAYSGRGPVRDGRIKPEMVAVGSQVYSTGTNSNYSSSSGTSFASPSVAGVMALLYEQYKGLNGGSNPNGDLMKAIIVNSSRDLGNPGPDFIYGFGAMDAYRATDIISNGHYLSSSIANGGNNNHSITIPAGVSQVKIMLYWHDVEAAAGSTSALINDLDLTVDDPSSTNFLPLVLDTSRVGCIQTAVPGVDDINNIEQIVIDNPTAGTFTINVSGTDVPMGSQDYVIVYDIIEDHLQLASPLGGETYQTGEDVNITWNAAGFDANDFTLEYSLDNGASWVAISGTIPGDSRSYEWTTPNTYTEDGLMRITWNGTGLTSSESLSNFTIMDVPQNLNLDLNCDRQIDISWDALVGAASYDVMEYSGGAWTMLVNTSSTSHLIAGLTPGETYYYSVRAVDATGIVGSITPGKSGIALGSSAGTISIFPYLETFEAGAGDWFTYGKNSTWQYGTPTGTIINRAAEGDNCWVTNLSGNYQDAEGSYLVSPCFDLSGMTTPTISFALNLDIEDANDGFGNSFYDYARLEYSNNGEDWSIVGTNGGGHNWYNNYMGIRLWDDTKGYWHSATDEIPSTGSNVMLRFVFNSDGFTTQEGLAIDNIRIYDNANIYNGADVNVSQTVSGTNWIDFMSAGDLLVSINPNGQNLGSTSVDAYLNTAGLRDNGQQYYLDRNWKITPSTAPASDVGVRLYFLDSEVEILRNMTGGTCPACSTIGDAFIAGVTKYSGDNENGDLLDNTNGTYSYFIPADAEVVPFGEGYYVEFETSDFSEFYINGGHTDMDTPLPVELIDFTLTKDGEDAIIYWTTSSELNSDRFIIEMAEGDRALSDGNFLEIGAVNASGESFTLMNYQYLDSSPNKSGTRYYRIKMLDLDGSFEYTDVKSLYFGKVLDVVAFPNPSKGAFNLTINACEDTKADIIVYDQLGRLVLKLPIELLEGQIHSETILTQIDLPVGGYYLELRSKSEVFRQKLLKID